MCWSLLANATTSSKRSRRTIGSWRRWQASKRRRMGSRCRIQDQCYSRSRIKFYMIEFITLQVNSKCSSLGVHSPGWGSGPSSLRSTPSSSHIAGGWGLETLTGSIWISSISRKFCSASPWPCRSSRMFHWWAGLRTPGKRHSFDCGWKAEFWSFVPFRNSFWAS